MDKGIQYEVQESTCEKHQCASLKYTFHVIGNADMTLEACFECEKELQERRQKEQEKKLQTLKYGFSGNEILKMTNYSTIYDPYRINGEGYPYSSNEEMKNQQKLILRQIRDWFRNFKKGDWLTLYGGVGTGKTVILQSLVRLFTYSENYKIPCRYITWNALNYEMKNGNQTLDKDPAGMMKIYKRLPVIMVDELFIQGVEKQNDIYEIFDSRCRNGLSIISASNVNLKEKSELKNAYNSSLVAFMQRLISRQFEKGNVIELGWEDMRG
jgi:DNA replication protein DnaC